MVLFCNGTETCDAILDCVAGVDPCPDPLGCDEGNDQCTGCVDDADCDDEICCTTEQITCVDNVCNAGTPEDCDDGVACTVKLVATRIPTHATTHRTTASVTTVCSATAPETCDAILDCEAGVDPCPDPADCDEENDQCDHEGPTLIPAALLSVGSGCETYIGAHPVVPGACCGVPTE